MSYPPYVVSQASRDYIISTPSTPQQNQCGCYDQRFPSYNTVIYGDTIKGFLPAGSYDFTQEGTVVSSCNGRPLPQGSLFARTNGPIYGPTLGACVPRSVQSGLLDKAGWFNPLPSTLNRKCFA